MPKILDLVGVLGLVDQNGQPDLNSHSSDFFSVLGVDSFPAPFLDVGSRRNNGKGRTLRQANRVTHEIVYGAPVPGWAFW